MSYKNRPFYKARYQMGLAIEITGKKEASIRMMMRRKEWSLEEVIRYYLTGKKNLS